MMDIATTNWAFKFRNGGIVSSGIKGSSRQRMRWHHILIDVGVNGDHVLIVIGAVKNVHVVGITVVPTISHFVGSWVVLSKMVKETFVVKRNP
jgi:hypothetical protein